MLAPLLVGLGLATGGCRIENPEFNGLRDMGANWASTGAAADTTCGDSSHSGAETTGGDDGAASGGQSAEGESDSAEGEADSAGGESGSRGTAGEGGTVGECDDSDLDLLQCFDFEELVDSTTPDGSSYGHDAEATGAGLITGPWGRALEVSSSTAVGVVCFPDCAVSAALTLEASIRLSELPTGERAGIIDDEGEHGLFVTAGGALRCSAGSGEITGGVVTVGAWYHVACVYDGSALRAYVDGIEVAAQAQTGSLPADDGSSIALANTAPAWDEPLIGALDRVRVWGDARTVAELVAAAES